MSEGWHVFNNLLVSLFPLLAAFVGIALLGLVLRVVLGVVRRSED
ncbi:MAG: hypothetical protein QJR14_06470 [Bacillota bacterium]|nr:hypothetical protein [Bacillota bacterium]